MSVFGFVVVLSVHVAVVVAVLPAGVHGAILPDDGVVAHEEAENEFVAGKVRPLREGRRVQRQPPGVGRSHHCSPRPVQRG